LQIRHESEKRGNALGKSLALELEVVRCGNH
jgi:hypothetical protein